MAKNDMTIAEQLKRAAQALEEIDSNTNAAQETGISSPAPAGSLSAELLRADGLLRYGSR